VKLLPDYLNLCDHNPPTLQTDGQVTFSQNLRASSGKNASVFFTINRFFVNLQKNKYHDIQVSAVWNTVFRIKTEFISLHKKDACYNSTVLTTWLRSAIDTAALRARANYLGKKQPIKGQGLKKNIASLW